MTPLRWLRDWIKKEHRKNRRRRLHPVPLLEQLEDRVVPSTFVVDNTADDGPGSLRQAIHNANASADTATIVFQIDPSDANFVDVDSHLPGGDADPDVYVIRPSTALPDLNNPNAAIIIDGSSQANFGGDANAFGPEIVINGSQAGATAHGLIVASNDNEISELAIQDFGGDGIAVFGTGNRIQRNAIHSNVGLGIDLGDDGATANDVGDLDSGPNDLQNYPIITLVEGGATTRIVGVLQSSPQREFTLDFFANAAADPSGFGEGARYLGTTTVTTDAIGTASFDVTFAASTQIGEFATATATDEATGSTSEFSGALRVQAAISISDGALTAGTFTVLTTSGAVVLENAPTDTPQRLTVDAGNYFFRDSGGSAFQFSVDTNGRIGYDAALASFLNGAGTSELSVAGHGIDVNASALTASNFEVRGIFNTPYGSAVASDTVGSFVVLPGGYFVVDAGGNSVAFRVENAGTITYDDNLEPFLDGAGTTMLTVHGYTVQVTAPGLTSQSFDVRGPINVVYGTQHDRGNVASYVVLPGTYFFVDHGGNSVGFQVESTAKITYDENLEAFLDGAGTTMLTVHGYTVQVTAPGLTSQSFDVRGPINVVYGTPHDRGNVASYVVLPGTYFFVDHGGNSALFSVTDNGQIAYQTEQEAYFDGAGTDTLTVQGHNVQVTAPGLTSPSFTLRSPTNRVYGTEQDQDDLAKYVVIPGSYFFADHGSNSGNFRVDVEGRIAYQTEQEAYFDGAGTDTLTVQGYNLHVTAPGLTSPTFFLRSPTNLTYGAEQDQNDLAAYVVIPGSYFFTDHGSNVANFRVDGNGHIAYQAEQEAYLDGAGTDTLSVLGYSVQVTAPALTSPTYLVRSPTNQNYGTQQDQDNLATYVVLPGSYFFIDHGGGRADFRVDGGGLIRYEAEQEVYLDGADTGTLTVQGHTVSVDATTVDPARTLFLRGTNGLTYGGVFNGGGLASYVLLPGTFILLESTGGNFWFQVDQAGLIQNLPEAGLDHVLSGNGTSAITFGNAFLFVTTTEDNGPGSLRQAILDANNTPGKDLITFDVPDLDPGHFYYRDDGIAGSVSIVATTTLPDASIPDLDPDHPHSWFSIQPESALPAITETLILDGFRQPGALQAAGATGWGPGGIRRIELDGIGAGDVHGLVIQGSEVSVRGLVINRFGATAGVLVTGAEATDNSLIGNFIGTDVSGLLDRGNARHGVRINAGASNNVIGGTSAGAGNVLSGNGEFGVDIRNADGNTVAGNIIGLNAAGTSDLGNTGDGLALGQGASNNTVGGTVPEARNVISGNDDAGVIFRNEGTTNNVVIGNYIGTDVSGTLALGNVEAGVTMINGPSQNRIGGPTVAERNVISGNRAGGVRINRSNTSDNLIQGNFIGLDKDGAALGNDNRGIYVFEGSHSNIIGGGNPGEGNVIGNNAGAGIEFDDSDGNVVQGNVIGLSEDGTLDFGNTTDGVLVWNGSTGNLIGTDADGANDANERNVISGNDRNGVRITDSGTVGNTIRGNSIYSNGELGIDLGGDGVTPNDPRDLDDGPNDLQNVPVIGLAQSGSTTRVAGVLHSRPLSSFTLDFYAGNEVDPSGHGEGRRWLGSGVVTTDANGNGSYEFVLDAATESTDWITATATNANGSTSELSQWRRADAPANTLVVTNTNESGLGSLRQAILDANQIGGTDPVRIWFRLVSSDPGLQDTDSHLPGGDSLPDVFVFTPQEALPALTRGNVIIDGDSQFALGGNRNVFGPEIVLAGDLAAGIDNVDSLVSHYRFNGTVEDVAGDNEPSATAGINFVDGKVGQGVAFEPGGYVDVPHSDDLAQQTFTLSAWVRPDGPGPNDDFFGSVIVAKGFSRPFGQFNVSASLNWSAQSNRFLFGFGDFFTEENRIASAGTFAAGEYYHVAATYDGLTFRLYVDGELQGEKELAKTISYDAAIPWTIGSAAEPYREIDFARTWNGVIDEVGIFNRALTVAEIESLATPASGLQLASARNQVRGLNVQQFSGDGILVTGDGNELTGNYIGTNAVGDAASPEWPGIVGWWPGAGNADDVTGNFDGALVNGTTFASGKVGQAFSFDGVDDAVTTPLVFDYDDGVTFELWVKTTDDAGALMAGGGGASAHRGMGLFVDPGGVLALYGSKETPGDFNFLIFGPRIDDGAFHHVAATWTGDTTTDGVRLYLDGVLIGTATAETGIGTDTAPIHLGGHTSIGYFKLEGVIDEPTAYDRVLSASEIQTIVSRGSAGKQPVNPSNGGDGIRLVNSSNNRIGGTTESARNVISGNTGNGITITGDSHDNQVAGNYVGASVNGIGDLGNALAGVLIEGGATNNLIGGTTVGARNLISGNDADGVRIEGANATGNRIQGNYVGLIRFGHITLDNRQYGVHLFQTSGNLVGTDGDGVNDAAEGNVIASNVQGSIRIFSDQAASPAANNVVAGNKVGTLPSGQGGTSLGGSVVIDGIHAGFNRIGTNADGAGDALEQNVIYGIAAMVNGAHDNLVAGNHLGVSADGLIGLAAGGNGVVIFNAPNNLIGGTAAAAANVIGSYTGRAVEIDGAGSTGNLVQGNFIGTNPTGTTTFGSGFGVRIWRGASNNTIGGAAAGTRNVISGNVNGVVISNAGTAGNLVAGNFIGTDVTGTLDRGNANHGVLIDDGASGNVIGGATAELRNVISGNQKSGISVSGGSGNVIQGNYLGTDVTGAKAIGNDADGINLFNSSGNQIGGAGARTPFYVHTHEASSKLFIIDPDSGQSSLVGDMGVGFITDLAMAADGTLYAATFTSLYVVNQSTGAASLVGSLGAGTMVGLDFADDGNLYGVSQSGGGFYRIDPTTGAATLLFSTPHRFVGDVTHFEGDLFYATAANDHLIEINASTGETVDRGTIAPGELIPGIDFDDQGRLLAFSVATGNVYHVPEFANSAEGVLLSKTEVQNSGATAIPLSVLTARSRNVIAGNKGDGIRINGGSGNAIEGNYVGLNAAGTGDLGNEGAGVNLIGASDTTIGGPTAAAGNVISGNDFGGVNVHSSPGTTLQFNFVGLNASGTAGVGNTGSGVTVQSNSTGALIRDNVISGNLGRGADIGYGIQSGFAPTILGNIIGLNAAGNAVVPNAGYGIITNGIVGGTTAADRNVISGNALGGIRAESGNVIQGNYVGTDVTGLFDLGNGGVGINVEGSDVVIGGLTAAPGTGAGNVISGNALSGIVNRSSASTNLVVRGNLIGLGADGVTQLGNDRDGVEIVNSSGNLIGGDVDGARNVISGNTANGITITGGAALEFDDKDQFLAATGAVDATGPIPNLGQVLGKSTVGQLTFSPAAGTTLHIGAGSELIDDWYPQRPGNEIALGFENLNFDLAAPAQSIGFEFVEPDATMPPWGGTPVESEFTVTLLLEGQVVDSFTFTRENDVVTFVGYSSQKAFDRVEIRETTGTDDDEYFGRFYVSERPAGNVVQGNLIGTTADGIGALANTSSGVHVANSAGNLIGGTTDAARNVISANGDATFGTGHGIYVKLSTSTTIQGNYIGTTEDGLHDLGNSGEGIELFAASDNLIGGGADGAGNVISANHHGVFIQGDSTGNRVQGNLIGTDRTGTRGLGNEFAGVLLHPDAFGNVIGTNGDGTGDAIERNVIADNGEYGVSIRGGDANIVAGNWIGVAADNTALGNVIGGILLASEANFNRIGTDGDGVSDDLERNVISGNSGWGIYSPLNLGVNSNNVIAGNYVGTDVTGTKAMGNALQGLFIAGESFRIGTDDSDDPYNANERNVISANGEDGIYLDNATSMVVAGNFIGVAADGQTALGNSNDGIELWRSSAITIGGTSESQRNVISGNSQDGIRVSRGSANVIQGNYVGTDVTGSEAFKNFAGIRLEDAFENQIGGTESGAGNVIASNVFNVRIAGADSANNVIQGNFIGTDFSGSIALIEPFQPGPNANENGIQIESGAHDNVIGGSEPGAGNLISGHREAGVVIFGGGGNVIEGNRIGTDASGTAAIANVRGVQVDNSPKNEVRGNLISGNFGGIGAAGAGTTNLLIEGNRIGTDVTGNASLANQQWGILVNGAVGTRIGGTTESAGNVIAGDGDYGVDLRAGATGTVVQGNYVGASVDGLSPLSSRRAGIFLSHDVDTLIGGAEPGAGNVIFGAGSAIAVGNTSSLSIGGRILGNRIGTTPDGTQALGDGGFGIRVNGSGSSRVEDLVIGGAAPGAGNLISGNATGIIATGADVQGLQILGNRVGTDLSGSTAIANDVGISLQDASGVIIGGTAAGAGNLVSGNEGAGLHVVGGSGNTIQGNFVGTAIDGASALGNGGGIALLGSSGNRIGGSADGARNVISASTIGYGVVIQGLGATQNVVEGNYVGTDVTGTLDLGNAVSGALLQDAKDNTLRGNVISANRDNGVFVVGSTPTTDVTNLIEANFIGTDATGTRNLGNALMGVRVQRGTGTVIRGNVISGNDNNNVFVDTFASEVLIEDNFIGPDITGNASLVNPQGSPAVGVTLAGRNNVVRGNVISANGKDGVNVDAGGVADGRASGNVLQSNLIGVGADGVTTLGNGRSGIRIDRGARNNVIGAATSGADGNVIAFNAAQGVIVADDFSTGNSIRGTVIHSNGGLGIDLAGDGFTPNDRDQSGLGPNHLQDFPELLFVAGGAQTFILGTLESRPNEAFALDFYASSRVFESGVGEGRRYLGSAEVTTNALGVGTFRALLPASTELGEQITATATGADGSTSEFAVAEEAQIDRNEPNDTPGDAGDLGELSLENGAFTVEGLIAPTGDRDLFKFKVSQGTLVEIQTFADREGSLLDTVLRLLDNQGIELAKNDDFIGRDSIIRTEPLAAGTYLIEVSGFQGSVGQYRLQVSNREFVGPQVLRLTPSTTVSAPPSSLNLILTDNDINPDTLEGAIRLEQVDASGAVTADHTALLSREYDATTDRLTLKIAQSLPDGQYRLTIQDSVRSVRGLRLDGDKIGGPGGDFVGLFGVDATAPAGTITQTSIAGENATGVLYGFDGTVTDAFPAKAGEQVRVQLDVDGDGFDDGASIVSLSADRQASFFVAATTGLASGQGAKVVRARFVDARGNVSAPRSATVQTDLPVVTGVGSAGDQLTVRFNLAGLQNVANPASYSVAGEQITAVSYDNATRTARLSLQRGLPDGLYQISVFSGPNGIRSNFFELDGDADGTPGGDFASTVLVDRAAPVILSTRLAPASDSGIAGDNRTNVLRPSFLIELSDRFPTAQGAITILLDVDGDGFDDGKTDVLLVNDQAATFTITAATPIALQGAVPIRLRAIDAGGNSTDAGLTITVDRQGARVLASSNAQVLLNQTGRPVGIRFRIDLDSNLDPNAAVAPDAVAFFAAGRDGVFYDGDDINRIDTIQSMVYQSANPLTGTPANLEVIVGLASDGSDNDDYELTVVGQRLLDEAGNPLVAGDFRLRFQFETLPPIVESAFLLSPIEGQAPEKLLVQFRDVLGLQDQQGRFLRDGDHQIRFTIPTQGEPAVPLISPEQPNLNPGGPVVQDATLSITEDGAVLTLTFDAPLLEDQAVRPSNYVIATSGRDQLLGTPDDDLLVLDPEDFSVSSDLRSVNLNLQDLAADQYLLHLDGTGDAELVESTVLDVSNYVLNRRSSSGQLLERLPIGDVHYNAFGDRVILSGIGRLDPGQYRLEVLTGPGGITNRAGTELDGDRDGLGGDSYVRMFDVAAPQAQPEVVLNPDAFERNHAALEAFTIEVEQQLTTARKNLFEASVTQTLLDQVELVTQSSDAPSEVIAANVNKALQLGIDARLSDLPIIPDEFVVVWGNQARFVLSSAAGQTGIRLDGLVLDDLLAGSSFATEETSTIAVAVVPLDALNQVIAGPPAVRLDGVPVSGDVRIELQLEGLAEVNQFGILFYGKDGFVGSQSSVDVGADIDTSIVTPPQEITGFDPAVFAIDAQVISEVEEVLGSLSEVQQNVLVLWVDPVDYVLLNAKNQQKAGHAQQKTVREVRGAYYSGDGMTELLVIPNAPRTEYKLELFGLGAGFRGAFHFAAAQGPGVDVPFQGRLARNTKVTLVIDVRDTGGFDPKKPGGGGTENDGTVVGPLFTGPRTYELAIALQASFPGAHHHVVLLADSDRFAASDASGTLLATLNEPAGDLDAVAAGLELPEVDLLAVMRAIWGTIAEPVSSFAEWIQSILEMLASPAEGAPGESGAASKQVRHHEAPRKENRSQNNSEPSEPVDEKASDAESTDASLGVLVFAGLTAAGRYGYVRTSSRANKHRSRSRTKARPRS